MAVADVTQTTAASQPLLLAHSGVNYLFCPRVDGNNCTTPNSLSNIIVGSIDIIAYVDSQGSADDRTILGKGTTALADYDLAFNNNNNLYAAFGGFTLYTSTVAAATGALWVRVTRDATNGDVKFYTSTNSVTTNPQSVSWTQLGATIAGPIGVVTSSLGDLTIGKFSAYANNSFQGKIYRATISNSIGGAPVVDFNPASYNAATSQTAWTSSTGEVWTINTGTAADTLRGVLVNRTIVQGLGTIAGYNLTSAITRPSLMTNYLASSLLENEISNPVYGPSTAYLTAAISYYSGGIRSMTDNSNGGVNITANLKQLYCIIALYKAAGSTLALNNGASSPMGGTDTGGVSTGLGLLKGNQLFNSLLLSSLEDNSTTRTLMYNLLKSMNNNAF